MPIVTRPFKVLLIVLLCCALIGYAGLNLLVLFGGKTRPRRPTSEQNNLKQVGLVFKMYANESPDGLYPPLTPYDDIWMVDLKTIYPEFLSDISTLVSPELPEAQEVREEMLGLVSGEPINWERLTRLAARSYLYTGYLMNDIDDVKALRRNQSMLRQKTAESILEMAGSSFYRLKEQEVSADPVGIAVNPASYGTSESDIPTMLNHPQLIHARDGKAGANVLYMDGHVEFVPLNRRFPITPKTLEAFK